MLSIDVNTINIIREGSKTLRVNKDITEFLINSPLGEVYPCVHILSNEHIREYSLTSIKTPDRAQVYKLKEELENVLSETINFYNELLLKFEKCSNISNERFIEYIKPLLTDDIIKEYSKIFNRSANMYYGRNGWMVSERENKKVAEHTVAVAITKYVEFESREFSLNRIKNFLNILTECKIESLDLNKPFFRKNLNKIKHAILKTDSDKNKVATNRILSNICNQCGVAIPTKEFFCIDTGHRGKKLNICPFCMIRIANEAKVMQEDFLNKYPKFLENYEIELFTNSL